MRIGLVADTFSVEKGTGIARYSAELLAGLPKWEIDSQSLDLSPPKLPFGEVINHAIRMPYLISKRAGDLELLHATSPICALGFPFIRKTKKIVTYHDLTSLLCQDISSAFHTRLFAPLFLQIGRFADRIIADSSQTKEEMIAHLGISGDKITVVNLGVDDKFTPMEKRAKSHYTIGYVGALNRRKRLDYLLRAFHLLKSNSNVPARLAICGSMQLEYTNLVKLIDRLGLSDDVEFRGFVAEKTLVETYNSFDIFVLPSEWEGFGLPILEAQRCGIPVIIREGTHIPREVSAACLKAKSEQDMANKIYQLLTDLDLKSQVTGKGLEYSRRFTWERTVRETASVYEETICA